MMLLSRLPLLHEDDESFGDHSGYIEDSGDDTLLVSPLLGITELHGLKS